MEGQAGRPFGADTLTHRNGMHPPPRLPNVGMPPSVSLTQRSPNGQDTLVAAGCGCFLPRPRLLGELTAVTGPRGVAPHTVNCAAFAFNIASGMSLTQVAKG